MIASLKAATLKFNRSIEELGRKVEIERNHHKLEEELNKLTPVDLTLYPGGSAAAGCEHGGAGVVVTKGNWKETEIVEKIHQTGSRLSSSFDAEILALLTATRWLGSNGSWKTARILTDSRAATEAIRNFGTGESLKKPMVQQLMSTINRVAANKTVEVAWIPSHLGIPGNEMADQEAAAARGDEEIPSSHTAIVRTIRRENPGQQITHDRARRTYTTRLRWDEEKELSRVDRSTLVRFRTGHWPKLNHIRKFYGLAGDSTCPACGEEETNKHLFECGAEADVRAQTFSEKFRIKARISLAAEEPT